MSIDLTLLQAQQLSMSKQIILTDSFAFSLADNQPKFIGGTDVGFEENGAITRAAIVVLSYPDLAIVEYQIAKVATRLPYIPGLLSFRECPALLAAWKLIKQKPELLLVDGQGVAHPRRFGLACHLGLLLDTPTIGIAKNRLCGQFQSLPTSVGEATVLMNKNEQIGWILQSKLRCKPLFISSGHRICQQTALQWTSNCLKGYRLPEPTRFADAIASNKPLFKKIIQSY